MISNIKKVKNTIFIIFLMFLLNINTVFAEQPNKNIEFPKKDIQVIDFEQDFSWSKAFYDIFYNYKDGYTDKELEFIKDDIKKSNDFDDKPAEYLRNSMIIWERAKTAYKEFTEFRKNKLLEPKKSPIPLSEMQILLSMK